MLMNKPKALLPFLFVAGVCVVRLLIYAYVGIKDIGNFAFENYMGIFLNLVLYVFFLFYAFKYFIKENYITLNPLIFKCGISNLATLVALPSDNKLIFKLTALMLFLVPYVSDSEHAKKKTVALTSIIVLLCSVAVSVLYILHPAANYFAEFGKLIYNLDALNPTVEWILIVFLLAYKKRLQPSTIGSDETGF